MSLHQNNRLIIFALGSRLVSREWDVFQLVVICTVVFFIRNLLQGSLFFRFGDPCSGRDSLHACGKREDVKRCTSVRGNKIAAKIQPEHQAEVYHRL